MMEERITPYSLPETDNHSFMFINQHVVPELEAKLHQHDAWELYYVTHGFGQRIVGDEIHSFREGDVVLIPPMIPHRWDYAPLSVDGRGEVSYLMVAFSPLFINRCKDVFPEVRGALDGVILPTSARKFRGSIAVTIRRQMESIITMSGLSQLAEMLKLLPFVFTSDDYTEVGRMSYVERNAKRLMQISTYVMKHYMHTIALDDIAQEVGMNRSSFCIYFKKQKGITFSQFVTQYRLNTACELLRNSDRQVSDIAYSVGFSDVTHFVHTFTKAIGYSPTTYRKTCSVPRE